MAGQRAAAGIDGARLLGRAGSWAADRCWALAGALAALTGAQFKFTLITRASFNQGFALARLPVRGVAR